MRLLLELSWRFHDDIRIRKKKNRRLLSKTWFAEFCWIFWIVINFIESLLYFLCFSDFLQIFFAALYFMYFSEMYFASILAEFFVVSWLHQEQETSLPKRILAQGLILFYFACTFFVKDFWLKLFVGLFGKN